MRDSDFKSLTRQSYKSKSCALHSIFCEDITRVIVCYKHTFAAKTGEDDKEKAISNFAKLEGKDVGIPELDLVLVFDTGVPSTNVNQASALGRSAQHHRIT